MENTKNVLGDNLAFVKLISVYGSDADITEAARVSTNSDGKDDKRLINYLIKNEHWSPFEMVELKFHIKCPIFVARQWVRHRTANMNEVSGRYTKLKNEYYIPTSDRIRGKSPDNKQSSYGVELDSATKSFYIDSMNEMMDSISELYNKYIEMGVSNELARLILPLNTYTEFYWKSDLRNLLHFVKLRAMGEHPQWEIAQLSKEVESHIKNNFPLTYEAFINNLNQ